MSAHLRPTPLTADTDLSAFDCGVDELNTWLKSRAWQNEQSGATRTFLAMSGQSVSGYYALTVGSIAHAEAPGRIRRNMPDPIPTAILARLATDISCRGLGIGGGLMQDAVGRVLAAAEIFGIRALLIHALSEDARSFYERYGFVRSPTEPMTLMANLSDLRKAFGPGSP